SSSPRRRWGCSPSGCSRAESGRPRMSEDSAESIASPLPPGSRWGTLEILEHAGGGSFAQSYRARDTRLDREVVLTILIGSSSAGQILREARLLAGIRHP